MADETSLSPSDDTPPPAGPAAWLIRFLLRHPGWITLAFGVSVGAAIVWDTYAPTDAPFRSLIPSPANARVLSIVILAGLGGSLVAGVVAAIAVYTRRAHRAAVGWTPRTPTWTAVPAASRSHDSGTHVMPAAYRTDQDPAAGNFGCILTLLAMLVAGVFAAWASTLRHNDWIPSPENARVIAIAIVAVLGAGLIGAAAFGLRSRRRVKVSDPSFVLLPPEDPLFLSAAAEATRRWPEFIAAFRNPRRPPAFQVKAAFSDGGRTEHLWIAASCLTEGHVGGTIDVEPRLIAAPRHGDLVRVPIETVNDWSYCDGRNLIGLFLADRLGSKPKLAPAAAEPEPSAMGMIQADPTPSDSLRVGVAGRIVWTDVCTFAVWSPPAADRSAYLEAGYCLCREWRDDPVLHKACRFELGAWPESLLALSPACEKVLRGIARGYRTRQAGARGRLGAMPWTQATQTGDEGLQPFAQEGRIIPIGLSSDCATYLILQVTSVPPPPVSGPCVAVRQPYWLDARSGLVLGGGIEYLDDPEAALKLEVPPGRYQARVTCFFPDPRWRDDIGLTPDRLQVELWPLAEGETVIPTSEPLRASPVVAHSVLPEWRRAGRRR